MAVAHELAGHDQYSKKQNASARILFCDSAYEPPIFIIMRRAIFIDYTSVRAKAFTILDPVWSVSPTWSRRVRHPAVLRLRGMIWCAPLRHTCIGGFQAADRPLFWEAERFSDTSAALVARQRF